MWQNALNFVKPYYEQPHRFYHNFSHIERMLNYVSTDRCEDYNTLAYAILFHDIVYEIGKEDNEEQSCELYKQYYSAVRYRDLPHPDLVCPLIMATKNPFDTSLTGDAKVILDADLAIFSALVPKLLKYESDIFKEYQKFPIIIYREKRVEFLEKLKCFRTNRFMGSPEYENNKWLIDYVKNKTYKIGIYAGSFNPYHRGHQNIVDKAEKLFDKVIIAQGHNRDKTAPKSYGLDVINEVVAYDGLVTDIFNNIPENVEYTMIRGLRNGYDLQYEDNLRKFIFDQNPNIQVVYIFCDREYDHISSSMIRGLTEFGESVYRRYLP